jgi:hypothetical protein
MKDRFFHRARVHAPVSVAWDVFTNHERIGEFTNTDMKIVEPGKPDRNGLGCVREMETFGWKVVEIVNYWEPNRLFGYHILGGTTVTHHQGIVRFFPIGEQSAEWVYDMQNVPTEGSMAQAKAAGFPDWQTFLYTGFRNYMADLEAECERRAGATLIPAFPLSVEQRGV